MENYDEEETMGTRADFYVGRGEDAEWLGSVAWDGYPDGIHEGNIHPLEAGSEEAFREEVARFLGTQQDGTLPEQGWPWPWDDSGTTDFSYAFDGEVWASCYGSPWVTATAALSDPDAFPDEPEGPGAVFPDMSARKNVTMGKRSGLIVVSAPRGPGPA